MLVHFKKLTTKQKALMETFIRDKLSEWNFQEYIKSFEDERINYETFLGLETSDHLELLIPKVGPRAKFRKRLQEFKQSLIGHPCEEMEMTVDQTSVEEDDSNEMSTTPVPVSEDELKITEQSVLATQLFVLRHQLTASAQSDLMTVFKSFLPNISDDSFTFDKIKVYDRGSNPSFFFLLSPLKDLLRSTLKCCGKKLLSKANKCENYIKDIMDGNAYQKLLHEKSLSDDDITLLWNSDNVPFMHPQCTVWPLQFTINELPYQIRQQNVLVSALWCNRTVQNPDMTTFLKPFVDEIEDLAKSPLEWTDNNGRVHFSRVFALVCSSDAVARPLLRNCKQFNGEYGCDWCLHPGTMVDKGAGKSRTYLYNEQKQKARSEEMFQDDARRAQQSGNPVNGVKGCSVLQRLPNFDMVQGFVPEYSHIVLLGVTKQLVSLWLDKENSSEPWYIGNSLDELDKNLMSLKQDLIIQKPVSLRRRLEWKALDWQAFLLFYGLYVLKPFLKEQFFQHFHLLSCGIHMLLQDCISQDILNSAHIYLMRFVRGVGKLYGEEHVTFNCHQLIHLHESVQNWGPLWATSALGFERNNKDLQALLRDVVDDSENTLRKFSMWQNLPCQVRCHVFRDLDFDLLIKSCYSQPNLCFRAYASVGNVNGLNTDQQINVAVENLLKQKVFIKTSERFTNGHTEYPCYNSDVTDKKCTIKLKSGHYGEVHSFVEAKSQCMCISNCSCSSFSIIVARMFETRPAFGELNMDQTAKMTFVKAKLTEQFKAFFVHDIKSECVNMNGFIVAIPNTQDEF